MLDNNYYARSQLMKKERRKKKQESGLDDTSLYLILSWTLLIVNASI